MAVLQLESPLASFARLVTVLLFFGVIGIALASWALRGRRPELVRELWLRWGSWVVIAGVFLGALALGRAVRIALVGAVSFAAFREYARAVGLWLDRGFQAVVDIFIVLIFACVWWPYADASPEPGWYGLFMAMPVYGTLAVLAVPVVRDRSEQMLQQASLSIFGLLYFGWMLGHLAYLGNLPGGVGLVLFVAFLVGVNDVAAFVVGHVAGRHPLRPVLSPRKTWEGALGALGVVIAAAWQVRWLVPRYALVDVVVVAVLIGIGGALGDLALSAIKRDVGIKDWGTAIPGHGGVLDRLNSVIFAAPLCFHYTRYFFT